MLQWNRCGPTPDLRMHGAVAPPGQRLRRSERREQILSAATRAFARAGFAATSLDDLAAEARVTRVILYRHFESKADLYRAVLRRACDRLAAATGAPGFHAGSVEALLAAAADEPAAFRLLFHHAAREPEFRQEVDELRTQSITVAHHHLAALIPDAAWARWASMLVPTVAVAAVMAWLDAGQPDQSTAAVRIGAAISGVIEAARSAAGEDPSRPDC
jgi:AcrR family transcriptional regulator